METLIVLTTNLDDKYNSFWAFYSKKSGINHSMFFSKSWKKLALFFYKTIILNHLLLIYIT